MNFLTEHLVAYLAVLLVATLLTVLHIVDPLFIQLILAGGAGANLWAHGMSKGVPLSPPAGQVPGEQVHS